ncbi:hypothetical protein RRG08_065418 [Elysia crispata]|uniref:Uncharacterized protein n=1 Tax=Elysia crispata TaxID=231223 RepID=A0AAE1CMV4_9GAST|nr:hypothetical protein RRG08_065418 [Elysia crispata]
MFMRSCHSEVTPAPVDSVGFCPKKGQCEFEIMKFVSHISRSTGMCYDDPAVLEHMVLPAGPTPEGHAVPQSLRAITVFIYTDAYPFLLDTCKVSSQQQLLNTLLHRASRRGLLFSLTLDQEDSVIF